MITITINDKTIECKDATISDNSTITFVNTSLDAIKEFFGKEIIASILINRGTLKTVYPVRQKRSDINTTITTINGIEVELTTVNLKTPDTQDEIETIKKYVGIVDSTDPMTVYEYKDYIIKQTSIILEDYLRKHPLISSCHGGKEATYNITTEKRNMYTSKSLSHLTNKMAIKELLAEIEEKLLTEEITQEEYDAQKAVLDDKLASEIMTWNATGEPCEQWTDEESLAFSTEWDSIVTPLVSYQQHKEMELDACATKEEVDAIEIDYASADTRNIVTEYAVKQ